MKIIDISQEIYQGMPVYPGDPTFQSRRVNSFKQGDMCEVSEVTMGTHCGTHVDAPLHMLPDGQPLECFSLECFIGPCRVLTVPYPVISEKTLEELNVKPGERILLRTDPTGKYNKHARFNPAVLSMRAAQYLAQLPVKLVGIDAPTVENMELCDGEVHATLLRAGIPLLEGLRLEEADKENYMLSALPIRLTGENGAPCRAVLVEENSGQQKSSVPCPGLLKGPAKGTKLIKFTAPRYHPVSARLFRKPCGAQNAVTGRTVRPYCRSDRPLGSELQPAPARKPSQPVKLLSLLRCACLLSPSLRLEYSGRGHQ